MIFTIDHVHLRSTDPNAAAMFYIEALGAVEVNRVEQEHGQRIVVSLDGLNLFIESVPLGTARPPSPPHLGVEHLALRVNDLDAATRFLRNLNVKFVLEPREARPGLKFAFIEGPDDVLIEIVERSKV